MISDSDETYTSSTRSSTVPDRVQKLFERLKKEKSLDSRKNGNVPLKNNNAIKISKNGGKGCDFKEQFSANPLNSSKIVRSKSNFKEAEIDKIKINTLNTKNSLQQDGKIKKSAEEMWKEKMNSLVTGKNDSSETEGSESEALSDVLFRKAFTLEVSGEQYSKRKAQSKIPEGNTKETDFARKKAEEWLRASTLTAKDGKSGSRDLDIADSSDGDFTDSDSEPQTNSILPKRNEPKKSKGKHFVNGRRVITPKAGTSKSSTKPSEEKPVLKGSLLTKKTSLAGKAELPKKTGISKKTDLSKVASTSKKSDPEKKADLTRKAESVKKSVPTLATNAKFPETLTKSNLGNQVISKGASSTARPSINSTLPSATTSKVGQRSGQVTSKKISTNTIPGKKPNLTSETTKPNSKQNPLTTGIKKTMKKT